jgi:hypothetical protein
VLQRRVWSKGGSRWAMLGTWVTSSEVGQGPHSEQRKARSGGPVGEQMSVSMCAVWWKIRPQKSKKNMLFLSGFFVYMRMPCSCLGFLERKKKKSLSKNQLCGYSSCHLLPAVLVHVSSPHPFIYLTWKHWWTCARWCRYVCEQLPTYKSLMA